MDNELDVLEYWVLKSKDDGRIFLHTATKDKSELSGVLRFANPPCEIVKIRIQEI